MHTVLVLRLPSPLGFQSPWTIGTGSGRREPVWASPEYDVELAGNDGLRIRLAIPGFSAEELSVEEREGWLSISGQKGREAALERHRFHASFRLPDFAEVKSATLSNGLLSIGLERNLPAGLRPKRIAVQSSASERIDRKIKRWIYRLLRRPG